MLIVDEFFASLATELSSHQVATKFAYLFIWTAAIFFSSKFLRRVVSEKAKDVSVRYKMRKGISFFSYILFVIVLVAVFKEDMSNFAITMGVIGGGIAFALQEVIVSIAGWLAITLSSFYNVGDRVKIGATTGDVIDIGILRTTLMECGEWVKSDQYTGRIVRIANSYIFRDPVYNYSGDFPFLWDELSIPVHYGSSADETKTILLKVADEVVGKYSESVANSWEHFAKKFAVEEAIIYPIVGVVANDNWIEFSLRYVVDYKKRRSTKTELYLRILDEISKTNGRIKLSSSTLEVVNLGHITK